jgi:16S rRNA processing protein RimM
VVAQISPADHGYVLLGTVTRPHGIKGELKVRSFAAQPGNLGKYRRLFLAADEHSPKIECTSVQARVSGHTVILRLKECSTRERAEELVGHQLWLAMEDLPALAEDEYYLHSLLEKDVRTVEGRFLGRAEDILSGSGQDILVVRREQQECLIPVVRAFIRSIEATVVILDLPEGLLDIND